MRQIHKDQLSLLRESRKLWDTGAKFHTELILEMNILNQKIPELVETLVIIHVFQKNSRGLWQSWTLVKMARTDSNQYYSIAIGEAIQYSQECSAEPG